MYDEGLFGSFRRDHKPLKRYLYDAVVPELERAIRGIDWFSVTLDLQALTQSLVDSVRLQAPVLGGQEQAEPRGGRWRPAGPGVKVPTTKFRVAIQVEGDPRMLGCWPDDAGPRLHPIDTDDHGQLPPYKQDLVTWQDELDAYNQQTYNDLWSYGERSKDGPIALYNWVELTAEEEQEVADGTRNLAALFDSQRRRIEPIVAAIGHQANAFFDDELPKDILFKLENDRRRALARKAVLSISWPEGWKQPPPRLEPSPAVTVPSTSGEISIAVHGPHLASASFTDILRTIRMWADGVERYPEAFAGMDEDRLSDLLATTLNAALPGAQREVYRRGGRSDIFINADVLQDNIGPERVFIAESKWWDGPQKALEALEQLLRYLNTNDTAGVLIFFVNRAYPKAVRQPASEMLARHDDFESRSDDIITEWPILNYRHLGQTIQLCMAFIDISPLSPKPGKK
ncbi:hypothetical protein Rhe02_84110 [Rhizocola hellebori]|uniref:Uncharacterized protein n=1 Tax=Rhizocola hellebori TaxID=1392758 RepID=A0A8J3VKD2_9ACTN|nr:hypothetical protein [Rhizocola hellebori]GIH10344.1 hypothetical protein Rhe02_84110 [Rhizocola hellebori]